MGNLLNLSGIQLLHLYNGVSKSIYVTKVVAQVNKLINVYCLEQCLAHGELYVSVEIP